MPSSSALAPAAGARARVVIERPSRGPRSVAREAYAETPLRLLRPRNQGHAVWIFPTTLGPGMLGGDELSVDLTVGPGAACYVGSLGVARAFTGAARLTQRLRVEPGGLLVWAPDPLACSRGADLVQETHVELREGASLLLVDAVGEGRPALDERWAFARLRSLLRVTCDGDERLREQLDLRADLLASTRHLDPFGGFALVCALGPRVSPQREAWLAAPPQTGPHHLAHAAPLGHDGALLRLAAPSTYLLSRVIASSLGNLTETLGDDPRTRRF